MKKLLWGLLLGLALGVIVGVSVYRAGVDYACPSKACVQSADVTPVFDRGYFDSAHKIISESKESVHIIAFEIKYYKNYPNSTQNRLVRDLIYAKERGVDVKVLSDEYSRENNAYEILKANGVEVRMDSNKTTTHAKLIIVDGRIILIGSTNLSYTALEDNNEANVLIADEQTARVFESYFRSLWKDGSPL
ncbi:MAG: phospholipase D-like domain-containing protein [Candidatus Altiarchaeota archaeon]